MSTTQDSDRETLRCFHTIVNRQLIRRLFGGEALAVAEIVAEIVAEVPPPEGGWPLVEDCANELAWTGAIERAGTKTVIGPDGRERRVPAYRIGDREAARKYYLTSAREAIA